MDPGLADGLRDGESIVGNWVSIGHPTVAEVNGIVGFDFVLIDTEHSATGIETVAELVRALQYGSAPAPIVRVGGNDPVEIKRVLDIGVAGVMVPMVNTVAEAEAAVRAMRYPPEGIRGVAGGRATGYGSEFEEYVATANDALVTVVQIESEEGVENAEGIAAVEGVDALFVGPSDLSTSLGVAGEWESAVLEEAMEHVIEATEGTNTAVGSLALSEEDVERWMELGFDFLIVGTDTRYLIQRAAELKAAFEEAAGDE